MVVDAQFQIIRGPIPSETYYTNSQELLDGQKTHDMPEYFEREVVHVTLIRQKRIMSN